MKRNYPLSPEDQHSLISWQQGRKRGKIAAGLVIITFGVLFLLRETGVHIPHWALHAPAILIGIGLVVLVKHKFRKLAGYILIAIGVLLMVKEWHPELINVRLIWPIVLIFVGLGFIFRNRKNSCRKQHYKRNWKKEAGNFEGIELFDEVSKDDFIDAVSIFGGVQKNVISKQFKGADIVTIFGGNEINLSQADFTDKVVMDVTNIFGGTTLIIPANWQIESEIVAIFGGIEDKRQPIPSGDNTPKVVILRGTCIFGGIEINSFS